MVLEITKLPIDTARNLDNEQNDSVLIVATNLNDLKTQGIWDAFGTELQLIKDLNKRFESEVTFTVISKKRVIYSPTGPVDRDYDDVRRIADAAHAAVDKAIAIGSTRPLLINCAKDAFPLSNEVALLAALDAAHIPLEIREDKKTRDVLKVDAISFWHHGESDDANHKLLALVNAIEIGRIVTRDIGGSDPERMAAPRVQEYVEHVFKSTSDISVSVIEGQANFEKEYPLFAAVNRAASVVPRHQGRIIKLVYEPKEGPIDTTLFLVGKGITYDTGGADVKHGGHMAGMHRDKCGAAFVAGFFKTLSLLKPRGLKVYGQLCMARNSIGEECYVADELITSRANVRIRVGNTDAEGRMAMADSLCEAKEKALNEVNPQLYTIATLTGHVIRAYGETYTAIMSNGPARSLRLDTDLQHQGDLVADPYEISTVRREDYTKVAGKSEYEDLLQSTNNPSSAEARGHQFPAAFLTVASGLDKHGNNSKEKKIPYSHVDIAGSSGPFPGKPTGCPLPSFVHQYIVPRLWTV